MSKYKPRNLTLLTTGSVCLGKVTVQDVTFVGCRTAWHMFCF